MAGLAPAIHVFARLTQKVVDARHKAGHDAQAETPMTISPHLSPVVSIIAGVLILIMPRLLNYIVAIYLIVTGIIGLGIFK